MLNRTARRTSPSHALASASSAVVEALETRRMLYETGGHWENEDDLSFSYINVFDGGIQDSLGNALPDATIRSAILEAMSVWAGVVPVKIQQAPDNGPNPPTDIAYFNFDRLLRFGHHFADGQPASNDELGHAWGPDDLSSLAGDVHIDNGNAWGTSNSGSTADILELFVHEVGHALGMQHEDDLSCVMNSVQQGFYSGLGSAFLFQDDINGIQSLYGAGLGWVLTDVDRMFVSGTNSDDTITIDYDSAGDDLIVTSQGIGSFTIDEDSVLELVVDTRGGNDTVRIINLPADTDVVINAGSGNDTINVGGGDLNTNISSDVTVNGGTGTDTLYIRDGDDDGGTYDINPANLSKPNSNLVSYPAGDVEELIVVGTAFSDTFNVGGDAINSSFDMELQGNDGADTFNINFVDGPVGVSALGGNDNDTITVGSGAFDVNIDGTVEVDGGDSTDTLIIDDVNDVGGDTYEIDSASFSKDSGDGTVTFSNVTYFDVNGGSGIDEYRVMGVASVTTTTVDGRAGNDTFAISDYDYDSNIIGNLVIDGGGGTGDFIDIRDSNDAGNDPYTLTDETSTFGTAFYKEVGGLTFFSAVEEMHVQGNNDNNTFTLHGTELGTRVTLYGLSGNDDFFIGTGDLDPIDDELVIWAGGGNDSVTFDDSLDAPVPLGDLPDQYRITNQSVVKVQLLPNFEQPFDYFEVEDIVVEGNSDGNTFNVQSTGADAVLNGNDGNDRYNIGFENNVKDINHMVEADGGAGTDSL